MIQHFNVVNTFLARLWRGGVLCRNKKVFKPFYQEIVLIVLIRLECFYVFEENFNAWGKTSESMRLIY